MASIPDWIRSLQCRWDQESTTTEAACAERARREQEEIRRQMRTYTAAPVQFPYDEPDGINLYTTTDSSSWVTGDLSNEAVLSEPTAGAAPSAPSTFGEFLASKYESEPV